MKKNRSSYNLISRIAILSLVLLLAVGSTFSWYDRTKRDDETGNTLKYSVAGSVNANVNKVTVDTFLGTKEDGIVSYSKSAIPTSGVNTDIDTNPGELTYFKTVISDKGNAGDFLISLYLSQFSCRSDMGDKVHIGIIGPEKTYNQYTGVSSGLSYIVEPMLIEDNLYLKSNGSIEVYWFIEVDASYSGTGVVNLGVPYVVNN